MYLKENKIPKWKVKEELIKTQSFDSSLAELGTNGEFLNAKKVSKKLNKVIPDSCTAE
ncbi:hypothetical protein [Brumimicrobium mesophilum]|uniref:hypothetical protein n=1 Tax=Brumimicrobium mesophilum TaxID=392717 RepID=UPI00131E1EDD|nr:hypothetical protein [Brumimicrobium mesophilum]